MNTLRAIALLAVTCACAFAQNYYTAIYEASPSGAAVATTIQQPASPTKVARLVGVQIYSSVDVTITLEAAGAATATESTAISPVNPGDTDKPTLRFFTASNASAASTPINKFVLSAGEERALFFDKTSAGRYISALPRRAGTNYTIRTSSITGDVKITWLWLEE